MQQQYYAFSVRIRIIYSSTNVNTGIENNHTLWSYTITTDASRYIGQTITRNVAVLSSPSITITNLAIESDNSKNSLYAKQGDTIDIDLTIDYNIVSYVATILGMPQSETYPNSNTINISYVIPSDLEVEENATFSINGLWMQTDYQTR